MANRLVKQLFFQNSRDGVYLSVSPNLKGKIQIEDVKEDLLKKKIVNANFKQIQQVLDEASGELCWIGERFERYDPEKDKFIHIRIAEDALTAFLTVRFPQDPEIRITFGDLEYKLWKANIQVPIDWEKVRRIAEEQKTVLNEVIAVGEPPVHGEDARLEYLVDLKADTKPLIREDGRVDFHRINAIRIVEKDQLLVRKIPARQGKSGINVFGEPIPYNPGKDVHLPRGMNTYISPDELRLYAKISGHVYTASGLIHIERVFVVKKNVDFSTGDIHYIGDVVVNGDVKTGFTIRTRGKILVRGNVDGAHLISEEGDIEIEGGVFGKQRAVLEAKHKIKAGFVQHARLIAGGDIEINKYVLSSELIANGYIRIPNGSVIGGFLKSDCGIIAREIGSPKSQKTRVEVGRPIDMKIWMEALVLNKRIKQLSKRLETIKKQINFLHILEKRIKKLTPAKAEELQELMREKAELETQIEEITQKKNELLGNSDIWFEQTPFVQANHRIFPGVVIALNQFTEEITAKMHSVKYLLKATGVERKSIS